MRESSARVRYTVFRAGIISTLCFLTLNSYAQISTNKDKFLGNITTYGQIDYGSAAYYTLWNQITPENESKWASVEGNKGSYNWGSDNIFNYAKSHNFTYKFHALVWGAQYPKWFDSSMPVKDRYNAIVKWFDAASKRYPDLPMIDVVNEAVGTHQPGNPLMKESLGGGGKTGYDWLINAFELAHERWPNAILIYNDYNTFRYDTDAFIDLVRTLRDAGAPIDAYGCQSHELKGVSLQELKNADTKIQNALKMPMYVTEYDIQTSDDDAQLTDYKNHIPYFWQNDYCAGITLWGYIYGKTWNEGTSGIIKYENNKNTDRKAMTWLREYMASDEAINAKSPFPGMKKEISLYIKPASLKTTRGDTLPITVRATMVEKSIKIDSVQLYIKGKLYATMTEAPYVVKYVPTANGQYDLKAVVYTDNQKTYERLGSFKAVNPRTPFKQMDIPGTIQAEDFDKGGDGVTYHDSNSTKDGDAASYRSDCEGVDVVSGNGGKAIGYTNTDEWLEYTVNVQESGYYTYKAVVSSGTNNSSFQLALSDVDALTNITDKITVPKTADNDWSKYITMTGRTLVKLNVGEQIIRLTITGSSCNIDKFIFEHVEVTDSVNIRMSASPSNGTVGSSNTLTFTPVYTVNQGRIDRIKVLMNGRILTDTIRTRPFRYTFTPTTAGTNTITAIAVDTLKRESKIASLNMKVRGPYNGAISIPGTIEAENFDIGGIGISYQDDKNVQGDGTGRSDNEGVDIVKGNNGNAIGYTSTGEWLEYTVDVKQQGYYSFTATVSSGTTGSGFRIGLIKDGKETTLGSVSVPQTASNDWGTYKTVSSSKNFHLYKGKQVIRFTITGQNCNIDKVQFSFKTDVNYITADEKAAAATRYSLGGTPVDDTYYGITIMNGRKYIEMK